MACHFERSVAESRNLRRCSTDGAVGVGDMERDPSTSLGMTDGNRIPDPLNRMKLQVSGCPGGRPEPVNASSIRSSSAPRLGRADAPNAPRRWCLLLQCSDFWHYRHRDAESSNRSYVARNIIADAPELLPMRRKRFTSQSAIVYFRRTGGKTLIVRHKQKDGEWPEWG
jgi:hypothetical protein